MKLEVIALGLLLLFMGLANACISIPHIETETGNYSDGSYGYIWFMGNLSQQDKDIVADFIAHGYSVKKMTPEAYSEFLTNAEATNADFSTCGRYSVVAYREGFAGYVYSAYSNKTPECDNSPRPTCAGGAFTIFINDLAPSEEAATPTPLPSAPGEDETPASEPFDFWDILGTGMGAAAPSNSDAAARQNGTNGTGASPGFLSQLSPFLAYAVPAGAVLLLFTAFLISSIMNRRQQEAEPETQSAEIHRALSSETRLALLKELQQRDLTPTDLSAKVGKSKATVVEHLDRLVEAGVVQRKEEEGKKFVFYGLTGKGKSILRKAG